MLASMAERMQPRMPLAGKGNDYFRNDQEKGGNLSIPATSKEIAGNNLKADVQRISKSRQLRWMV